MHAIALNQSQHVVCVYVYAFLNRSSVEVAERTEEDEERRKNKLVSFSSFNVFLSSE